MAFCERCGKELGPDGKCDCQQTQKQETAQKQEAGQGQETVQKQDAGQDQAAAQKKKTGFILCIAAAVVGLLAVIIAVTNSSSYKTPVKDLVKLINKQSTDVFAYQELFNNPLVSDYNRAAYKILKKSDDIQESFETTKENIADLFDDIDGFKVSSCDFVKADKMKSSALRDIQRSSLNSSVYEDLLEEFEEMDKGDYEDLADDMDISVSDAKKLVKEAIKTFKALGKAEVKDGYTVTIRFYGKYDGDEDKTEKIEDIRIIKVNGTWYIYDASRLFSGFNFKDDLSDVNLYKLYRYLNSVQFGSF